MHYSVTVSIKLTTEILYHNISAPQNMNYSVSTNTQPTKGTAYRQFFLNNILYQLSTINFFTFYAQCMIMLLIDTTPGSVRTGRGAHLKAKESGGTGAESEEADEEDSTSAPCNPLELR
jgi:hypothetical protein